MVTETTTDDEPTVESRDELYNQNAFIELLGKRSHLKVFIALLDAPEPLNPSAIAENADIDQSTFYVARDALLDYGVIEQVDMIGNSPRFALVKDSELATELRKVADLAGARQRELSVNE